MEALEPLARRLGKRRALRKNEVLFRRGDVTRALFLVQSGCVELRRHTASGRAVTLHTAAAGTLFAEASLYSPHYHCDAVAIDRSIVIELPKRAVADAFAREPALAAAFSARLAAEVMRLRARLELVQVRNARERVLAYLEVAADERGRLPPGRPLKSLAAEIGLSHEALYRALAGLERAGLVRRGAQGEISLGRSGY